MCVYIYIYIYVYWRKSRIYKQWKRITSNLALLQRTVVNTWLPFFPFAMCNIYGALSVCCAFTVLRALQAQSHVNLSSYIRSSPPLYVHTYTFLICKARKIILFYNLVFLIHSIKISFCVIKYSSTESFITVAWCFIAGRFRASQTGVCVPLRAKPQYKCSVFSWSINLIQSFGRRKKHIILISKQVQIYHSLEQRAPMNFKIKQPRSRLCELVIIPPKTHVPCPLRMEGTSEKHWVLVQAPLFTD